MDRVTNPINHQCTDPFRYLPANRRSSLEDILLLLEPVKMIFKSVASYIPNLFIILVIYYCIKYIVKGIQYIANEIESENLKISGFTRIGRNRRLISSVSCYTPL